MNNKYWRTSFLLIIAISGLWFYSACGSKVLTSSTVTQEPVPDPIFDPVPVPDEVGEGASVIVRVQLASYLASLSTNGLHSQSGVTPDTNSSYPTVITTPETVVVGIWKAWFGGTGEAGQPISYVFADSGSWETTDPYEWEISKAMAVFCSSEVTPEVGTYTMLYPMIAFMEQDFSDNYIVARGIKTIRQVMSTYTDSRGNEFHKGDLLTKKNGVLYWMVKSDNGTVLVETTTGRPDNVMDSNTGDSDSDPFLPNNAEMSTFAIVVDQTFPVTLNMCFGLDNCLGFHDVNNNGIYEPQAMYPAGDVPTASMVAVSGDAKLYFGRPEITVTVSN